MDRASLGLAGAHSRVDPKMPSPVLIRRIRWAIPPLPRSYVGPVRKPAPPVPNAASWISAPPARPSPVLLLTRSEVIHVDASVPAGPPRPLPLVSKAMPKARPKPTPPKTFPPNLADVQRPDLSIVALGMYEPTADEPHIT